MAQNISLLGADYPDVPAVQLPRTGGGMATFYDVGNMRAQSLGYINGNNGTKLLTTVLDTKAVIFVFGAANKMAIINVNTPNDSTVYAVKTSGNASDISVSTSGKTLTITNTSQYSCTAVALIFDGSLT